MIYVGADSRKHMRRVAALEKVASDRANRKAAREAASIQKKAFRKVGGATMQMARKAARDRATLARREARRRGNNKPTEEYNRQREENATKKPKRKKPYHPMGPYATEKYTSYARRLERSKNLRASKINSTTYSVGRYTVKATVDGKAISCNCPDFTQIDGSRNWLGSNAGPFNPCKHMMTKRSGYNVVLEGTYLDNFGVFQGGGYGILFVEEPYLPLTEDGIAGYALTTEPAYWYKVGSTRFTAAGWRLGAVTITGYYQV